MIYLLVTQDKNLLNVSEIKVSLTFYLRIIIWRRAAALSLPGKSPGGGKLRRRVFILQFVGNRSSLPFSVKSKFVGA